LERSVEDLGSNNMIGFGSQYGAEIAAAAPASFDPRVDQAMVNLIEGKVAGGFLLTSYTGRGGSFLTHVAGFRRGWLTRELLFNTANYCFNHSGCGRIFGQVPATKPKVLAFDLKLGWKEVAFLDGVYPDGGCHVLSMGREDCRWLNWAPRLVKGVGSLDG
jgi:hypothetical protein